jgi:translation initiation factor 6 (eIF-6)|tara:strand:- start:7229 stop:7498 length:270 start_codon:yes stop_codon:yes gene_type:complete
MNLGDDIKPEITADWARRKGKEVLGSKVIKQLNECLEAIDNAINRNDNSASTSGHLHDKTKEILKQRGFKIEYYEGHGQREPSYHSITW